MTRRTRPGTIQAAVSAAYKHVGGVENVAADLGLSVSTVSYGTELQEGRGGLGVNYLDRLGRIDPGAAVPIAQHFALLAGGVFQPLNLAGEMAADLALLTREFSDVLAKHAEAHSSASGDPTGYTVEEAAQQVKELDELIAASVRMRASVAAIAAGGRR